jgi:hypothetical protein
MDGPVILEHREPFSIQVLVPEYEKEDDMLHLCGLHHWVGFLVIAVVVQSATAALPAEDVAAALAARLEQNQLKEEPNQGLWPPEVFFVGPATTGMVCAYEWTDNAAYRESAKLGGEYILWIGVAMGHLLGDEAYALMCLSRTADNPDSNMWRVALANFYSTLRAKGETTQGYIELFAQADISTTTFYLAHHLVAAYYVDDLDKNIWRDALIQHLSRVDDDKAEFPVMALGAATWALATTGTLDDTPVSSLGGAPVWEGVLLRDLPSVLLSHQVPEGEPFGGSFYYRFDHTAGRFQGAVSGYTEDAIYGALGLVAVASAGENAPDESMEQAIRAVHTALLDGVDAEGRVYEHLSHDGESYHAFAGEMLQGLWAIQTYLDSLADVETTDVVLEPKAE